LFCAGNTNGDQVLVRRSFIDLFEQADEMELRKKSFISNTVEVDLFGKMGVDE
jgi:hypothetical protein